jgi:hypothetical protein
MSDSGLRPVERRVRSGLHAGLSTEEVARRFGRSSDWVGRIVLWSELPRRAGGEIVTTLRPLERRVLKWRQEGADHAAIGARFNRGPDFIAQVERLAHYKLDQ